MKVIIIHLLTIVTLISCKNTNSNIINSEYEIHFQSGFQKTQVSIYTISKELLYSDILTTDEIEGLAKIYKFNTSDKKILLSINSNFSEVSLTENIKYLGINLNLSNEVHIINSTTIFEYD